MISGRQALATIEQAIAQARSNETRLDGALRSAEAEAARLREQRLETFKALAEVKLELIARNEFVGQLDAAERRAKQLLQRQDEALRQLDARREAACKAVEAAQAARHARADTLERAVHALDALTAEAVAAARVTPDWAARKEAADKALHIAEEADKKADLAEADRDGKKKPYEDDPLFLYLWKRKFGTADYASGYFVRFFDRKVADLVGYSDARANYHMLNEIPARLRAHADRAAAAAKQEADALGAIEKATLDGRGGEPLTQAVAKGRAELEAAERELAGKQATLMTLEKQREAAMKGDSDGAYQQAASVLAEADSRLDLRTLHQEAMQTPTTRDEEIVARIREIDAAIARAEQEIAQIRTEARELASRRVEIERVRDDSRRRGYDNPFGTFRNESRIGDVIGAVLTGALQGAVLDKVLRDGYRERSNTWQPDFGNPGGGGFTFPQWNPGAGQRAPDPGGSNWTGNWNDWIGGGGGNDSGPLAGGGGGDFTSGDSF